MKTHKKYWGTLLLSSLTVMFIAVVPAAAKWYKDYQAAQEAAQSGDWLTAIDLYRDALDDEEEPGERKRTYGMHFIDYYPYLELGTAYLEVGDHENALKYCQEAQNKKKAPIEKVQRCLERAETIKAEAAQAEAPPVDTATETGVKPSATPTVSPAAQSAEEQQKAAITKIKTLYGKETEEARRAKLLCALNIIMKGNVNEHPALVDFLNDKMDEETFYVLFECPEEE